MHGARKEKLKDYSDNDYDYSEYRDLMRFVNIPEMPLHSFVKNSISASLR
jgi:hypothetical protein